MAGESAGEEARRARERAERLIRRAEAFEKGAEGEAATAAVLTTLPPGWTAIHDVRWPSRRLANIDHVVVGPGGIYVIDSKNWSGRITATGGRLRQNGRSRETAVAACADAGLAIAELAGPHAGKVFPVLCFTTDDELAGWCRDVMVCSTSTLRHMLLTRAVAMDPPTVADARMRLDAQLRAATTPCSAGRVMNGRHGHRTTGPSKRRPHKRPGRSRRGSAHPVSAFARFVVMVAVLIGFVTYWPQISDGVGSAVAERLTEDLGSSARCDDPSPADKRVTADGEPGPAAGARPDC